MHVACKRCRYNLSVRGINFLLSHFYVIRSRYPCLLGVIERSSSNRQVLDKLPVERQRGITVKAQTATMFTSHGGQSYMVNLIDTPVG